MTKSKALIMFGIILSVSGISHAKICESTSAETTPLSRFTISADGTEVTDKKTGLTWLRCSLGQSWDGNNCSGEAKKFGSWVEALKAAKKINNSYRLPNIKEYMSIVERKCYAPAINEEVFPNLKTAGLFTPYWTSTPDIQDNSSVYLMDFTYGNIGVVQPEMTSKANGTYGGGLKPFAMAVKSSK